TLSLWDTSQNTTVDVNNNIEHAFYLGGHIAFERLADNVSYQFWDLLTGERLTMIADLSAMMASVHPSSEIVAVSDQEAIRIYNIITGDLIHSIPCVEWCQSTFSS